VNSPTTGGRSQSSALIIDAPGLVFRAYHSLPPMSAPDGTPTNAVFGLLSMLKKVTADLAPEHVAVVFDAGAKTFRSEAFADYKAQRPEPADDLRAQFPIAIALVEALGLPVFVEPGYEADDLIASLARVGEGEGHKNFIVTSDRDMLQLISPSTTVLIAKKGVSVFAAMDETAFRAEWGFEPDCFTDYKALRGDASDNIPGVRGIGEKTASALVRKYGHLEQIYAYLDEVTPERYRAALEAGKADAFRFRDLVTLRRDLTVDWRQGVSKPDTTRPEFLALARRLGFKGYIKGGLFD